MNNLPLPGDPLVHTFGSVVNPVSLDKDTSLIDAPVSGREIMPRFTKFQPRRELAKDKTPEKDDKQQVAIAAVVGLRLMGLSYIDIAGMFNVTLDDINQLINSPSAQFTFEHMYRAMINTNADNVQGRIASYAHKAIDTVIELMENNETRDDVRLKASQDILDRSGANAEQFFAETNNIGTQEDELRIVMMDEEADSSKSITVTLKRK